MATCAPVWWEISLHVRCPFEDNNIHRCQIAVNHRCFKTTKRWKSRSHCNIFRIVIQISLQSPSRESTESVLQSNLRCNCCEIWIIYIWLKSKYQDLLLTDAVNFYLSQSHSQKPIAIHSHSSDLLVNVSNELYSFEFLLFVPDRVPWWCIRYYGVTIRWCGDQKVSSHQIVTCKAQWWCSGKWLTIGSCKCFFPWLEINKII